MNGDLKRIARAEKLRSAAGKTGVYLLLTVWAVAVLFPFYWMLLTSLKSYSAYNGEYVPRFYTLSPTLQNYAEAFTAVPEVVYEKEIDLLGKKQKVVLKFTKDDAEALYAELTA